MRKLNVCLLLIAFSFASFAQEKIDGAMMQKIRNEGLNNSKVMEIAWWLTDANGPRLTNTPGYMKAANYAVKTLSSWGLTDAKLDPWGDFGKSWELQKSYAAMTAPYYKPIMIYPKVWTTGTNGLQTGDVVVITAKDSVGLDAYRGKLAGKIILLDRNDSYKHSFAADASRWTDVKLDSMANAKPRVAGQNNTGDTAAARRRREQFQQQAAFNNTLRSLAKSEGALGFISTSTRNHDGTVFVQGSTGNPYRVTDADHLLDVAVGYEDFMTLLRMAKQNMPVKLEIDVKVSSNSKDTKSYNVIAEIPGTDPKLKDEIVMLGAHLDSWQGSTGATDNASGSAVMMEAVRILKTLGVKPRRTIRIALWSGEEQGLLGSGGYVKKTFADRNTMNLLPAHEKFSAYYNIDNGTGKIRGIYAENNEAAANIFKEWLVPFHDLGAKTVTITSTGGTDHQSFDRVGLPGFQFIQDDIEYSTRTHHSNMDSYDHLIAEDLKQISVIVAAFVYNSAMRDEKLPRKELPKPREGGGRGGM
jgi:hypothetical protein